MEKLERIPKGFTPKLTNGEAILYISDTDQEKAVLENQREGILLQLPTQSALARGYWSELPK
jgi:hypothetical protein